jgi:hypothetical protein
MEEVRFDVQPLSYKKRQRTFFFLVAIFLISLPFLYLYATGYRFDYREPTNLVSTGGIYVAVERTGADIYIDGELVRETRTFRKAFYAQRLDVGTHRVHVQKEGYHTWVKELPVSKRLVTEAEALNLPLVPQVRIIGEWQTATGSVVVTSALLNASSTNSLTATTTHATSTFVRNEGFRSLMVHFSTTTSNKRELLAQSLKEALMSASSSDMDIETATTTLISSGVKLAYAGDDLYATWVGSFEQMPYYYCAPDFPAYSTTTGVSPDTLVDTEEVIVEEEQPAEELTMHPVQTVPKDSVCDPTIRIDRKGQTIHDFDFYPGSSDFVIVALQDGVYVVEVDDRSWQNVQPLVVGENLQFYIEGGTIYVYDGNLIYQILLEIE